MDDAVKDASAAALREAKRELLARMMADAGLGDVALSIPPRATLAEAPLSFAQEVLWLLDRATPELIAYNSALAFRLTGPLEVAALRRAVDDLVSRHEALRTRFVARGDGAVQVIDAPAPAAFEVEDLRDVPAAARDARLNERLRALARRPFVLASEHLFRSTLLRVTDDEAVLLLLTHHIVSDAWSYGVMLRELSALYAAARAGGASPLAAPRIQFGDFAAWERAELTGDRLREKLHYWRETLLPAAPDLLVPTDRPRTAVPAFEGGRALRLLSRPLLEQLKALALREGATLYMVLLAAYQAVLHRWSGQDDLVTGSAIAGRNRSETEGVIGYFSAATPLRTQFIAGESFRALLTRVRATVLGALEHQDVPAEALGQALASEGRAGQGALFQAVLTMQEHQGGRLELPGVEVAALEVVSGTTKFELTLLPAERTDGLELLLWYRADLFEAPTAERLLDHLERLLTAVSGNPELSVDALPLLSAEEQAELVGWNDTARDLGPATTMSALIQTAGHRRSTEPAVVAGDVSVTWEAFLSRGHQVARRLQALGVGPDVCVGLCIERSADLLVGMYGILAAGGAYVPLLPDQPVARIAQQLAQSGARLVVSMTAHRGVLPDGIPVLLLDQEADALAALDVSAPANDASADSLAYVLFTSGSTGVPKGVAVTHGNLVHYTRAVAAVLGVDLANGDAPWHFATVSTLAADLGHTSVFVSLASGGTLHVLPQDVVMDAARFQAYTAAHPLDVVKITPSHFQALAGPEFRAEHLPRRWLVLGGEPCPWNLVERVRAVGTCRVLNHYGPTESTVGACTFEPGARDVSRWLPATVPIGRPLPNVTLHILDRAQQPCAVGVPGELWIGGLGVARGYLGRDDLTRDRFVTIGGQRLYRTGDGARRLPTGDVEFLGRLDQQVKVRGHRVELGEVETVLGQHPSIRQAVVVLHEDRLVAYVVVSSSTAVDDAAFSRHVEASLPDYMVPASWIRLDAIPLNANGKVDRRALPVPSAPAAGSADALPRSESEQRLAMLWADVLKKDQVGIHDNFFALGGHSLLAIRLLGKIAKSFGVRLTLRVLFEHPTVASLAEAIAAHTVAPTVPA